MSTTDAFDIQRYNAAIRTWGREERGKLGGSLNALGVRATGALVRELGVRYGQRYGQVNYIGFKFARYGVFVEKGAGRGHGGKKGSRWRTERGELRRTNPASFGRMGAGGRPAKPWFNPVMEPGVERLADLVAEHVADMAVKNILIK